LRQFFSHKSPGSKFLDKKEGEIYLR